MQRHTDRYVETVSAQQRRQCAHHLTETAGLSFWTHLRGNPKNAMCRTVHQLRCMEEAVSGALSMTTIPLSLTK